MEKIILDGKNCLDIMSFYYEFYKNFTDLEYLISSGYLTIDGKFNNIGFNLDACDDILFGGFGKIEEGEKIFVIFKNYSYAKKMLSVDYDGNKFIDLVLKIFKNHSDHIQLKIEDN